MKTIYTGNVFGTETYRVETKGKTVGQIGVQFFDHIVGRAQVVALSSKAKFHAEVLEIARTLGFVSEKLAGSF